jgi:branched-chain amino acid transport system ATP-binding protein
VVLKNVSITINEGEIVAFIGPNGAGKSTLLKSIMGIVEIRGGSLSFNGTSLIGLKTDKIVQTGISFAPQGNRVFAELTVLENLEVGGYLLKQRGQLSAQIESVLQMFPDLRDRLKLDAGKLSGGEKQQLALARALMLKAKILLLDEPSLGLSPSLVTEAFDTILEINRKFNTTILIVEQKVREVLRVAGRVYALRMGQVVFDGTPAELQSGETMKKIFFV